MNTKKNTKGIIKPVLANIPEELKKYKQWVAWKAEQRGKGNQIVPSDQWDQEIMAQRLLKTLTEDRVNLDAETTRRLVEAIAEGRLCFVPGGSLVGLDINNMKKVTIH